VKEFNFLNILIKRNGVQLWTPFLLNGKLLFSCAAGGWICKQMPGHINGTPSFTCLIVDPRESQRLPEEKQIDCSCFGMRFL